MNDLRAAASFLTRIPLHRATVGEPASMSRTVPWFAVVGLILGALQAALFVGLLEVMTPLPAAALVVAALALITGAFHHDGLADMADAFGGGWTVEQRLEIMKDSRLGTYGVVALVLALIIEVTTIAAIGELGAATAASALVIGHSLSRAVAAALMLTTTPAQNSGLAADYLDDISRPAVLASSAATIVIAVALLQLPALAAIVGAHIAGALVVGLAARKIGGITGDVLGAIQQIAKLATLVAILIAAA